MADSDRKLETLPTDPDQLAKLLEIELIQNRARWQQTRARNRSFRVLAFLFLALVITGALAAYFYFLNTAAPSSPADAPTTSAAASK